MVSKIILCSGSRVDRRLIKREQHTILPILNAGQILQSGTIQLSERLTGDSSHCVVERNAGGDVWFDSNSPAASSSGKAHGSLT